MVGYVRARTDHLPSPRAEGVIAPMPWVMRPERLVQRVRRGAERCQQPLADRLADHCSQLGFHCPHLHTAFSDAHPVHALRPGWDHGSLPRRSSWSRGELSDVGDLGYDGFRPIVITTSRVQSWSRNHWVASSRKPRSMNSRISGTRSEAYDLRRGIPVQSQGPELGAQTVQVPEPDGPLVLDQRSQDSTTGAEFHG
jgi:hypothetical protein